MPTVLFLSHPQEACGVHQFGKRIFEALQTSQRFRFIYRDIVTREDALKALGTPGVDAAILNWHPRTMACIDSATLWPLDLPKIAIVHTLTDATLGGLDAMFDYYVFSDPSLKTSNPRLFPVGRPIPDFKSGSAPPSKLTIGSFGFATPGKGFEALVDRIQTEFDSCVIRLNIPGSFFYDRDGTEARAIADRCRRLISKPNLELEVSHEFLSNDGVLEFLSGNSLNAFFYESTTRLDLSSAVDLAIAAGRPIALTRSSLFRHLFDSDPSLFVEDRSLTEILRDGDQAVAAYKAKWTMSRLRADFESMLDKVLEHWNDSDTRYDRARWLSRLRAAEADVATLSASAAAANDRAEMADRQLEKLRRSRSWRATRPFRFVARRLRAFLG